ncbi:MAG: hypothetical protein J6Y62_03910 [Clostridia bacterium]|nr:hypothetical protein [Clostridia bacterium]
MEQEKKTEGRTEAWRWGILKRMRRQPLPPWMGRIKGRGFYFIRETAAGPRVEKGVAGEIVVASGTAPAADEKALKGFRKEISVRVNVYKAPFDVVKGRKGFATGFLGSVPPDALFLSRREAKNALAEILEGRRAAR